VPPSVALEMSAACAEGVGGFGCLQLLLRDLVVAAGAKILAAGESSPCSPELTVISVGLRVTVCVSSSAAVANALDEWSTSADVVAGCPDAINIALEALARRAATALALDNPGVRWSMIRSVAVQLRMPQHPAVAGLVAGAFETRSAGASLAQAAAPAPVPVTAAAEVAMAPVPSRRRRRWRVLSPKQHDHCGDAGSFDCTRPEADCVKLESAESPPSARAHLVEPPSVDKAAFRDGRENEADTTEPED